MCRKLKKSLQILVVLTAMLMVITLTLCLASADIAPAMSEESDGSSEESTAPILKNFFRNGSFDTNLNGWSTSEVTWEDGKARMSISEKGELGQTITVVPGTTYTISGYVSNPSADAKACWLYGRVKADSHSVDLIQIGYDGISFKKDADENGYFEKTYTPAEGVTSIEINFSSSTSGYTVYFDDLFMTDGVTLYEEETTTTTKEPTTVDPLSTTTKKPTTKKTTLPTETNPVSTTAAPQVKINSGDANDDGAIDMKDVLLLRKFIAHLADTINEQNADCNGDTVLDMKDVLLLRKYLAGFDVSLVAPTTTTTTKITTTTVTTVAPVMPESPLDIDLVTLSIHDQNFTEYGVSFHSFMSLTSPVIQLVSGEITDEEAFLAADPTVIGCKSGTLNTKEFDDYDKETYYFNYDWSRRGSMTTPITSYYHQGVMKDLDFGSVYSYRVGDAYSETFSPIYTFKTRDEEIGDFSYLYFADTQPDLSDKGDGYKGVNELVNIAYGVDPDADFVLHGGDYVYCNEEGQGAISQWRNMINGCNNDNPEGRAVYAGTPWFITDGNHDNFWLKKFFNIQQDVPSSTCYSYDYGPVHFIILDSETIAYGTPDENEIKWFEQDLEKNAQNPNTKWTIINIHWSFYCTPSRDIHEPTRTRLLEIIDKYHVDLVMCGHVNSRYYTTYPVKDKVATTKESTNIDGTDYFVNPEGTIYMQNGASGNMPGKSYNKTSYSGWTDPSLMLDCEGGYEASFAVVSLTEDGTKLTVKRYHTTGTTNKQPVLYSTGQFGIIKN